MQKNIVVFVLDQLTWRALPAYGNKFAKTPNIDRITEDGLSIDGCYTTCPLCQPARASFWTGRYPHETGVLSNGNKWPETGIADNLPTLGETFLNAGWQTVHFGKTHDQGALRGFLCEPEKEQSMAAEAAAFPLNTDSFRDAYTAEAACSFLEKRQDKRPLLMVADLVNPHNICGRLRSATSAVPIIVRHRRQAGRLRTLGNICVRIITICHWQTVLWEPFLTVWKRMDIQQKIHYLY